MLSKDADPKTTGPRRPYMTRLDSFVTGAAGKRLTYKALIA